MADHINDDDFEFDGDDDLVEQLSSLDDDVATARANALRIGLEEYALEDDDIEVLEAVTNDPDAITYMPALPVLAVVGRPNVGKSALVNRILGRREAVVEDTPGVTRDRVSYKAEWNTRRFTLVDTGGWEPDAKGINASVAAQAEVAIDLADAVLFVVDANVGATATDEHVVRLLRKTKIPVYLVANKVDDARQEPAGLGGAVSGIRIARSWCCRPARPRGRQVACDLSGGQARNRRSSPRGSARTSQRRKVQPAQQDRR